MQNATTLNPKVAPAGGSKGRPENVEAKTFAGAEFCWPKVAGIRMAIESWPRQNAVE
jgi:hypothetical protein